MNDVDQVVRRMKLLAPQFSTLSDDTLNLLANDAISNAQIDGFKAPQLLIAAGYLAAHYASIVDGQNSNVKKQTLSVMSVEYQDKAGASDYLTQYQTLLNSLANTTGSGSNVARFI